MAKKFKFKLMQGNKVLSKHTKRELALKAVKEKELKVWRIVPIVK